MTRKPPRPKFINLFQIHFPVTAVLSILHRVTGVVMVLAVPPGVYLFGCALESPAGFSRVGQWLDLPWVQIGSVFLVWALSHHTLAGVRYLLIDADYGLKKHVARATAYVVLIGALVVAFAYAWSLV